ncbi:MAG: type II secretion system GspH family protein [Puniceicoccales bacterium]|nr:type II secretion system GspH family protein [Puniceicoccales bacterium]
MRFKGKGFTLIEFLGVMAIISLLVAMVFPAIGASRHGAMRQRARWQLLELKSALESYHTYYGNYPPFLRLHEIATPINGIRGELLEALQGVEGIGAPPMNPHNVRFLEFSPRWFNEKKHLIDALGNEAIYVILRRPDQLTIPIHAFPERLRRFIPDDGLVESIAIYSLGAREDRDVVSWE